MYTKNVLDVIHNSVFDNEIIYSSKPIVAVFVDKRDAGSVSVLDMMQEIAETFCDQFKFVKVNINSKKLPNMKYEISSLPAVIIYCNGCKAERVNEGLTYESIISTLENLDEDELYLN